MNIQYTQEKIYKGTGMEDGTAMNICIFSNKYEKGRKTA